MGSRLRPLLITSALLAGCEPGDLPIAINEVVPQNTQAGGGLVDRKGGSADWFEIVNLSTGPVNIGMFLVVGPEGNEWRMPRRTVVDAQGYVLVFADDTSTLASELHAPLQLRDDGTLTLYDRSGRLADEVTWPALRADHSWARTPDGSDTWVEDPSPTPLAPNG